MFNQQNRVKNLTSQSIVAASILLFLLLSATANAAVVSNEVFDFQFSGFVSCANDGQGEVISGSGERKFTVTTTVDGQGVTHFHVADNLRQATAVGEETGQVYQVNFNANVQFKGLVGDDGFHQTITRTDIAAARGSGAHLVFHQTSNLFIDANGVVRVDEPIINIQCN